MRLAGTGGERRVNEDDYFRAQDIQFLALLRSSTLVELMRLEHLEENQLQWRQAAISRAFWRVMLK